MSAAPPAPRAAPSGSAAPAAPVPACSEPAGHRPPVTAPVVPVPDPSDPAAALSESAAAAPAAAADKARGAVPVLADARSVAEVLLGEGVEEVLVYGSVARGSADERSDIDLVAIFADIDYGRRHAIQKHLEAAADAAAAWPVQVHVTDRPEWRARVANVSASFEHFIGSYTIRVAINGIHSQPKWAKTMVKPMNNAEEALQYFNDRALARLSELASNARESFEEVDPGCSEQEREEARLLRMVRVCEDSAIAVELCLKALAALHGAHPPSEKELRSAGHDIRKCLELIPEEPRRETERLIRRRNLNLAEMSTWRTHSTYPDDVDEVRAAASVWAADYLWTARTVCQHTLEQIHRAAGDTPLMESTQSTFRRRMSYIADGDLHTNR